MPNLRGVGREAEDQAADYLLSKGYTIVTRRFKARHGELDIVALDGDVLVFVEVKNRRAAEYSPEEALDAKKRLGMISAAHEYIVKTAQEFRVVRYDLVAIDADGLRHYEDAFRA
jgi:putative endonuclease